MSSLSIAKAARASQRTRSLGQQQEARARYVNRMSKANPHREPHSSSTSSKGTAAVDLRVQLDEARVAVGASDDDAAAVREAPHESDDARPLPRTVEVSFADLAVGPKRSKRESPCGAGAGSVARQPRCCCHDASGTWDVASER